MRETAEEAQADVVVALLKASTATVRGCGCMMVVHVAMWALPMVPVTNCVATCIDATPPGSRAWRTATVAIQCLET